MVLKFEQSLAEIEGVALKNVEFEVDKVDLTKPPF